MSTSDSAGGWVNSLAARWRSSSELRLSIPLSSEEVLKRMRQASLKPAFFRLTGPEHSVVSRFQGHKFSLVAAEAITHTHARHFYGEVLSADGATVVQGRFQQRPALQIGQYIIATVFLLAALFSSVQAHDPRPAVVALLVIACAALLNRYQMLRSAHSEDDVRRFLAAVTQQASKVD